MATKSKNKSAPTAPVSTEMTSLLAQVIGNATPAPLASVVSAKAYIRNALSVDGVEKTIEQMTVESGKKAVNIRTMLSDLRSAKYAGKPGVFVTVGIKRADGKTYYSKAPLPANAQ